MSLNHLHNVVMGISPDIWGPNAWMFIHLMVLSEKEPFDQSRLPYYQQFYEVLTHLLPCETCRNHLKENLAALQPVKDIKSKRDLFNWTVDLHNAVNKLLNKGTINHEDAFDHWTKVSTGDKTMFGKECLKNYWKYSTFILAAALLIAVGGFLLTGKGLRKK